MPEPRRAPTRREALLVLGEGFLGGLALHRLPHFDPSDVEFDSRFARAWAQWEPAGRDGLPTMRLGLERPSDILRRVASSRSGFRMARSVLTVRPSGESIEDYLGRVAAVATVAEWRELASLYLDAT